MIQSSRYGNPAYFTNRELSWLLFNKRVLSEARDTKLPLFERLKFLSITASNLDEFFMVRVGSLQDQMLLDTKIRENKTKMTAEEQIKAIVKEVKKLNKRKDEAYEILMKKVAGYGIELINFASAKSEANNTTVGISPPTLPEANVPAKFVLKPLTTLLFGSFFWISEAAEPSAGTTNSSQVSKFNGLVISTTIFPSNCSL